MPITAGGFDTSTGRYVSESIARSAGSSFFQAPGQAQTFIGPSAPGAFGSAGSLLEERGTQRGVVEVATGLAAGVVDVFLDPGVPGGEIETGAILPGGQEFFTPDLPVKVRQTLNKWFTGTATFWTVEDEQGKTRHFVSKKVRRKLLPDTIKWVEYHPKKPTVIGNVPNKKNINKTLKVMKSYKKIQKDLNKLMPSRRRTTRKVC